MAYFYSIRGWLEVETEYFPKAIFLQDIQSEYPQNTKLWLYLQGWCWQNNRINWRRYFLWSRCCSR